MGLISTIVIFIGLVDISAQVKKLREAIEGKEAKG